MGKMCLYYSFIFALLVFTINTVYCRAPPFITKCKNEDENCAKAAAKVAIPYIAGGLPDFGVEQLDPNFLKKIDASTKDLKLVFTDVTMKGLKECKPNKIERNPNDTKMSITITCDIDFYGQYEMDGKLLFLPIQGKGRAQIKLRKLQLTNKLEVETITDGNGVRHWNIQNWNHSFKLKDQALVSLENLFSANKALADITRDFVAKNGNAIVNEAGPPIISAIVANSVNNINNFFHTVPVEKFVMY